MVKRIVLISSFVLSLVTASTSWGGEHLNALPGKVDLLKTKSANENNHSAAYYNLQGIAERLIEGTQESERVEAVTMLQQLNVMASAFDVFVGRFNIAAEGSYFMQVQHFMRTVPQDGTYDGEVFAERLTALIDGVLDETVNNETAFDAFFAYMLNRESVAGQWVEPSEDNVPDDEENIDEDFFAYDGVFGDGGVLRLPVHPVNETAGNPGHFSLAFGDDDDGDGASSSSSYTGSFVFTSQ